MLNKKLLYITTAGLVSSMFPVNTDAQTFYQCMPCPVGTSSKNGKCETCPMGTYTASSGSGSCLSCDSTEFSNAERTRCFKINDIENWNRNAVASAGAGSCITYTIPKSGLYAVYLKGGDGGYGGCYGRYGTYYGGKGGSVTYKFTATQGTSIQLCAGTSGELYTKPTGGGGGAGSWIKIGNSYIVAGGGGGGGLTDNTRGQGGGGGAIGGGGSGDDYDCGKGTHSGYGGSVGSYKGGASHSNHEDGSNGTGINTANAGKGARGSNNGQGGSATGVTLYSGYVRTKVGGDAVSNGSATHNTNLSISLGSCTSANGCARIYSWRFN